MTTTEILPIQVLKRKLEDRRLTIVAKRAGLSHPTVKKVARGDEDVSLRTLRRLSDYFSAYG